MAEPVANKPLIRLSLVEAQSRGEMCYEGPCERDSDGNLTGYRQQCFHTDTGCDDCYLVESPSCI
jgi:hypothetical protein